MTQASGVPLIPILDEGAARALGQLKVRKGERQRTLPLAGVDLRARVAERVVLVTMTQTFQNPLTEPLEAVYLFPLAGGSAVSAFEMKVGDRVIKGLVKERGEARRTYRKAVEDGKRAALLEQERDDVFTVQVGNLPPGEAVTVTITYSERLPFFEDGTTELRLPLVVAPRYIPGAPLDRDPVGDGVEWDTDLVPDASRITPPRLAKGFDPKVALGLRVDLESGQVADLACSQHAVRTASAAGVLRVELARENEILNRDFVLRWRLAADDVRPSLLVSNGIGMLTLVPPKRDGFLGLARDVVFVVDRSGSMAGPKMASAARACSILLRTLGPRDRFAIEAFDDRVEWWRPDFSAADEAGIQDGDRHLRTISDRGGTELDGAMDAALGLISRRKESKGRAGIVVLLTDGQVGDESRVLKRLQSKAGDARIFTVGIDTAVNDGFLKRLASLGGGTSTFVVPGEALEAALKAVGREIGEPLVTELQIEGAEETAPACVPDLFAGRAATVFFKVGGEVRVRGKLAGGGAFDVKAAAQETDFPAIAQLWARTRVADLEDRFRLGENVKKEIVDLALAHTLLTRFTAFVVVDEKEIVNPQGEVRRVVQPVEMPDLWGSVLDLEIGQDTAMLSDRDAELLAVPPPPPPAPRRLAAGHVAYLCSRISHGAPKEKRQLSEPAPQASPEERKALAETIRALDAALAKARTELGAGRRPDPAPIAKAREALLALLAGSLLGQELAALQRFLRSALLEILAAFDAGAPAAALKSLFDRHAAAWESAKRGEAAPSGAPFWEASV